MDAILNNRIETRLRRGPGWRYRGAPMHLVLPARIQLDPDEGPSGGIVTWFDADIAGGAA